MKVKPVSTFILIYALCVWTYPLAQNIDDIHISIPCGKKYSCNAMRQYCQNKITGACANCNCDHNPDPRCKDTCAVRKIFVQNNDLKHNVSVTRNLLTEKEKANNELTNQLETCGVKLIKVGDEVNSLTRNLTTAKQLLSKREAERDNLMGKQEEAQRQLNDGISSLFNFKKIVYGGVASVCIILGCVAYDYLFHMKQKLHNHDKGRISRADVSLVGRVCLPLFKICRRGGSIGPTRPEQEVQPLTMKLELKEEKDLEKAKDEQWDRKVPQRDLSQPNDDKTVTKSHFEIFSTQGQ